VWAVHVGGGNTRRIDSFLDVKEYLVRANTSGHVGLYKILLYLGANVHESIIFYCRPPTRIARMIALVLHDDCAIYDPPSDPPFVYHTRYNI